MSPRSRARLLLIAAAVLFSTGGAAVKGSALNSWQIAGARSLLAALFALAVLPGSRRGLTLAHLPVAVSYSATLILFVTATKLTTAANAIFLQDSAPLFVLLLSPLVLGEPIVRSDLALMAVVACGLGMVFLAPEAAVVTAPDPARGNVIAVASAITWALTLVGLRWIGRHGSRPDAGISSVFLGNLITCAVALPFACTFPRVGWVDVGVVLWLGLFQVGLAYVFLTRGLRSVPAIEATVLLLLEPALNPVWTWLVHGERPAPLSLAGGGLIILAILGRALSQTGEEGARET